MYSACNQEVSGKGSLTGHTFGSGTEDDSTNGLVPWFRPVAWFSWVMPTNIEIKARLDNLEALLPAIATLADEGPDHIVQDDTFFACDNGRLKLRVIDDNQGVLIYYRRADELGAKSSYYECSDTSDPDGLRSVLTLAYGEAGRVRKRRTIFRVGQTRVHLDRVEGLGDFLELEVVIGDGLKSEDAVLETNRLMTELGVGERSLVKGAYSDLLAAQPVT